MNFTHPLALIWALLAVPIVVFYILKIRLRRVPVSTVMFWSQIFEEKRPRSIWQQLRHLVSLLLQLLFLALVVWSLADPYWSWERLQAQRVVLVVDNSASMNATDVAPSRLEAARQQGRRLIDGLRARDQMAIVAAGSTPKVVCGLTGHQRTLRDALDAVPASDGPTRVAAAVELGRRLLAGHDNPRIAILSDGCFVEAAELTKANDLELLSATPDGGNKTANVGITQFQVRRSLVDSIGYQIQVEVQNFSDQPVECRLEIDLGDDAIDVLPLKLAAEERASRTLEHASAAGGRLVARLKHDDALSVDNQAVALLPPRQTQRVLLVSTGSVYLQRVFEAIPAIELRVVSVPPERVPPGIVVVYHRQVPPKLPGGHVLVIDPRGSCDAWTLGEELENPLVGKQLAGSPLLTHVRLDNVWMPAARKLTWQTEPLALVSAITGEPMYVAVERQGDSPRSDKLLVLSVDLDRGDLPLRTAFPILMTNAIGWFQGGKGELREAVATGSLVEVAADQLQIGNESSAPEKLPPLVLRSPDGGTRPLPAGKQQLTLGPLDRAGVWSIEPAAPPVASQSTAVPTMYELASNLANAEESDLRPHVESRRPPTAGLLGFAGRPIWFYLTLVAAALISVEWFLYQRRWIS